MTTVVIDPGHGGTRDAGRSTWGGVRALDGTLEKDVTLALARRVAGLLGPAAHLTRGGDDNLPLAARADLARRLGAAAFVSIHLNQGPRGARGAQAFVHTRALGGSRALARALAPEVYAAELAVLAPDRLPPRTAACLLEVDYLTDPAVARSAHDPGWLDATSRAIAAGLQRYLGTGALAQAQSGAASVSAFATVPFADPFTPSPTLQARLDAAIRDMRATFPDYTRPLPIAVVALDADPARNQLAINLGDQTDFIASLAKVNALYPAFELRRAAGHVALLPSAWRSPAELKALLDAELDPQIRDVVPRITPHQNRTPDYRRLFDLAAATPGNVPFRATYQAALVDGLFHGHNAGAKGIIDPLGFQYINGALAAGGFFDASTDTGLWLTGNFVDPRLALITSHNDALVGQTGTPRMIAKLFTLFKQGSIIDAATSAEMAALVNHGGSWFTKATIPRSFAVTHVKVGVAGLKSGVNVFSEGAVVTKGDREFVVAWQDYVMTRHGFDAIAHVVEQTLP